MKAAAFLRLCRRSTGPSGLRKTRRTFANGPKCFPSRSYLSPRLWSQGSLAPCRPRTNTGRPPAMAVSCTSHDSPFSHRDLYGEDHPVAKGRKPPKSKPSGRSQRTPTRVKAASPAKPLLSSSNSARPKKKRSIASSKSSLPASGSVSARREPDQRGRAHPSEPKHQAKNKRVTLTSSQAISSSSVSASQSSGFSLARVAADSPKSLRTRLLAGAQIPDRKPRTGGNRGSSGALVVPNWSCPTGKTGEGRHAKEEVGGSGNGKLSKVEVESQAPSHSSNSRALSATTRTRLAHSSTTEVLLSLNRQPQRPSPGGGINATLGGAQAGKHTTTGVQLPPYMCVPRRAFESVSKGGGGGGRRGKDEQLTASDVARGLGGLEYRHVVVMSGAGISTPSGIPDFRTPGTGLYDNLKQYNIPYPEAVFDISFFAQNPKPFLALARELYPGKYSPNPVHHFIRLLQDKEVLLRNYTQNIDGLERIAGVKASRLVEAHGSFSTASCLRCGTKQDAEEVRAVVMSERIPRCKHRHCMGLVKPDIVFFGEDLPQRFHSLQLSDFSKCDLLIIMGTSLEVEPFASLAMLPRVDVPRVLINREAVGPFKQRKKRLTDVAITGDLVECVRELSVEMGWGRDLEALIDGDRKGENDARDNITRESSTILSSVSTISEVSPDESSEGQSSSSCETEPSKLAVEKKLHEKKFEELNSAISSLTITGAASDNSDSSTSSGEDSSTGSDRSCTSESSSPDSFSSNGT